MASGEPLAYAFWRALCRHDRERAAALLACDAVFHPAGLPAARGSAALDAFLDATGEEQGVDLETVACYGEMIIAERIGRVAGAPAGRQQLILSLVRSEDGRITSWQDFFEPSGRRLAAA